MTILHLTRPNGHEWFGPNWRLHYWKQFDILNAQWLKCIVIYTYRDGNRHEISWAITAPSKP